MHMLKQVLFSKTDGKNKRGRPKGRWTDDLVDWCQKDTCTVHLVQTGDGGTKWSELVKHGHLQVTSPWRKRERGGESCGVTTLTV